MRLGDLLRDLGFDMVAIACDTTMSTDQIEELCDLDGHTHVGCACHCLARMTTIAHQEGCELHKQTVDAMLALAWPLQSRPSGLVWDTLAFEAMGVYLYG